MSDQAEIEQLAEAEYEKLQKHLRSIQLNLKSLNEEKNIQLKKQQKTISVLQGEHEKLKEDIRILEEGTHARKKNDLDNRLEDLYEIYNDTLKKIEVEKNNIWELENHTKKLEKEIDSLRKNQVPDSCYKETIAKAQKDVIKLENRLDVVNKKCSNVLTENSHLRDEINHMLQDRAHFNEMWQSMVTQFNEGKKYIMDLIDQSTMAYDQREELCTKLQQVKSRNESDRMLHIQEMREIQRKLEHDSKLHEFYDVKGHKRVNFELEQREATKKAQQKDDYEKELAEYTRIIEEIKVLCDEEQTEKFAAQYTRQEEENFALFNYVNELSHEVELLNETTQELTEEIDKQKADEQEKAHKRKAEALESLELELARVHLEADKALQEKEMYDRQLQDLLKGIENVFNSVDCADTPILNVLTTKPTLTVHNVHLFLGIIDKKIKTILATSSVPEENSARILAKKDRIPKFNVKEDVKKK